MTNGIMKRKSKPHKRKIHELQRADIHYFVEEKRINARFLRRTCPVSVVQIREYAQVNINFLGVINK